MVPFVSSSYRKAAELCSVRVEHQIAKRIEQHLILSVWGMAVGLGLCILHGARGEGCRTRANREGPNEKQIYMSFVDLFWKLCDKTDVCKKKGCWLILHFWSHPDHMMQASLVVPNMEGYGPKVGQISDCYSRQGDRPLKGPTKGILLGIVWVFLWFRSVF